MALPCSTEGLGVIIDRTIQLHRRLNRVDASLAILGISLHCQAHIEAQGTGQGVCQSLFLNFRSFFHENPISCVLLRSNVWMCVWLDQFSLATKAYFGIKTNGSMTIVASSRRVNSWHHS